MTLSYSTVKDADLAPLSEAVARWKNLPGKFTTIATSFRTEVADALRASDWEGEAAKAAFKKFGQVQKQMGNAADEAADVHRLLDSALESFRSARKRLRNVADEVAEDRNLRLSSAGLVYLDPDDTKKPERLAVLKQAYEDVIRGYNDRVKAALEDATDADTALHWALSQDPNGRSPGFHPDMFRSVREARQGRDRARKDADTLVKLTSLGPGITDEQLEQFNRLARKHEGDPYFAERFAVRAGPEGTLRFWQGIADQRHHSDKDALKTLAGIQKSLSHTLAAASHSKSEAMQEWKKKMVDLGDERIYFVHSGETAMLSSQGSYGFSIMSSMMRHGEYETGFLKDYGKELYSFEMKHEGDLKELWYVDDHKARLSFGSDSGNDPMVGYMEALGHNPEASKEMFLWEGGKKEGEPEYIKYIMEEREWFKDSTEGKKGSSEFRYDELGHALEAATLGIPYDQPEAGLNRNDGTANVMSKVVNIVTENPGYISERPGIGDSIAKAGVGYIDDLNWSISDFGGADYSAGTRDAAFQHSKGFTEGSEEGSGHVELKPMEAAKFMAYVGQHEGNYEIMASAQQEFTSSLLRSHSEPDREARIILETGAKANGILDSARSFAVLDEYGDKSEEAERKLAEASAWESFAVEQGVGLGSDLLSLPFETVKSPVVSFVVPALIETAAGAIETQYENSMNRQMEERMKEFEERNKINLLEFTQRGSDRSMSPLDAFVEARKIPESSDWPYNVDIEGRYNDGGDLTETIFER